MNKNVDLVVAGLGGGSGNMVVEDALAFNARLTAMREAGYKSLADHLGQQTRFVVVDSDNRGLNEHFAAIPDSLMKAKFLIGKRGRGTSMDPDVGREAMTAAIKKGDLQQVLFGGDPVAAKPNLSLGKGGTSAGGAKAFHELFQEKECLVMTTVTADSFEHRVINYDQSALMEDFIQGLDERRVGLVRLNTASLYKRNVSLLSAYRQMDRLQGGFCGPSVRLIVEPGLVDYMDVMRRVVWSPPESQESRRWMFSSFTIKLDDAKGSEAEHYADLAAATLLDASYFDFDLAKAGGGFIIIEGELPAKFYGQLSIRLNERLTQAYIAVNNGAAGNPNIRIKDDWLAGSNKVMTIGLWLSTYNGLPTEDEVPILPFDERMGSVAQIWEVEREETGTETNTLHEPEVQLALPAVAVAEQSESDPAPSQPPDYADVTAWLETFSQPQCNAPLAAATADRNEQAADPIEETAAELVVPAAADQPQPDPAPSQPPDVPQEPEASSTAPVVAEKSEPEPEVPPVESKEPPVTTAQAIQAQSVAVPTATYRSLTLLADAAYRFHRQEAKNVLQADPYQETLPDGRRVGAVLLFPLEGEGLADQVVKALPTLVLLKKGAQRLNKDDVGFSAKWAALFQQGLRICGKWIPESVDGKPILYGDWTSDVETQKWWAAITHEQQEAIKAGLKICQLVDAVFLTELSCGEIRTNKWKVARGAVLSMINSN